MSEEPIPPFSDEYMTKLRETIDTGGREASFVIDSLLHADEMPPPATVEAFWKKVEEDYRDSPWAKLRILGTPKILANARTMADILRFAGVQVRPPAADALHLNTEGPAHE